MKIQKAAKMKSMFSNVYEDIGMNKLLFAKEIDWDWLDTNNNISRNIQTLSVKDVKSKISFGLDEDKRPFIAIRCHVLQTTSNFGSSR